MACTPSTTVSFFSPSPNRFSGKANHAMTPIYHEGEANNYGSDALQDATGEDPHHRRRRSQRPNGFDRPVIRRPFGGLVVRLIDQLGMGSGSWSR
jgi:hypothetical protein